MLINGIAADSVSARDRGFRYGDGLFETIAVHNGKPGLWDRHMGRLATGCSRLKLPSPDPELLLGEAGQVIGNRSSGVLKIIISRGSSGRGYEPPERSEPTRVLSFGPWPDQIETRQKDGVRLRLCSTRLGENPSLAGIKHLNRLEQVLARSEWRDPAIAEGLMQDCSDRLIEGTMSNLFVYRSGVLSTPDLSRCGVEGILRSLVLETAAEFGMTTKVCNLQIDDAMKADALFVTNSLIGIWPVREFEQRSFPMHAFPGSLRDRVLEQCRN